MGTRLHSVVGNLPKVLAPVSGYPFIDHVIGYLQLQGTRDIVICTGYGREQVVEYCADGSRWGVNIRYSTEDESLGTGGAIKNAEFLIMSDPFLVLNGDSLVLADLPKLLNFYTEKKAKIAMMLTEVPDKGRFGSVMLSDADEIVGFNEKNEKGVGLINAGIYLMDHSVLQAIPEGCNVSFEREVFPRFENQGLYGLITPGPFIDIGTPDSYACSQTLLRDYPFGDKK